LHCPFKTAPAQGTHHLKAYGTLPMSIATAVAVGRLLGRAGPVLR
jgi:hypothetical protein